MSFKITLKTLYISVDHDNDEAKKKSVFAPWKMISLLDLP